MKRATLRLADPVVNIFAHWDSACDVRDGILTFSIIRLLLFVHEPDA